METKQISCDQKLWLIAQNLESDGQIFYTMDNPQFHFKCRFNELHGRRIQACFHGWVILSDHSNNARWSLWNPLTFKFIRLPPLITNEKDYYECCLPFPPEDQGSILVLLSGKSPTIFIYRLGPKKKERLKWIKRSYAKQLRRISGKDHYLLQCLSSCNGKVYAIVLSSYKFVIQVDIVVKGKEVVISLLPLVRIPSNSPCSRCPSLNTIHKLIPFLKGSYTELFYIEVGFNKKTIAEASLFKLDMTSKTWKQMVDLEDAVFFLEFASGYYSCYYYNCAVLGGYIHILGECGRTIYSFHVKDKTMSPSSLSSCPVQESSRQASAWAMLEWRLKVEEKKEIVVRPVKGSTATTGESLLLNMPSHILELIMKLCIGVEYMKFRATCKHFCLAAPPIQWSRRQLRSYSLASPWLMVLDNYRDIITFIDPMHGDSYFITTPQQLRGGYEIHCSKYGWLLMYENKGPGERLVFFNPFTGTIRELPWVQYMESFCFSAPPTSPDCMVVGFTRAWIWHVFIHFVSGESRWHTHNLKDNPDLLQFRTDPYNFNFPTFSGRRYIYALCDDERIEAFRDMTGDGYHWELVANIGPSRSRAHYFLSNCDQHLLLVIIGEFGRSVEVFKVDEFTCEEIDDLGKHMIYISNASCICLEAKTPEIGNKIYFPSLLHDDNSKIVFYSLETRRYHTFDDKKVQKTPGFADLFGTKSLGHPHAWIEPSWSE